VIRQGNWMPATPAGAHTTGFPAVKCSRPGRRQIVLVVIPHHERQKLVHQCGLHASVFLRNRKKPRDHQPFVTSPHQQQRSVRQLKHGQERIDKSRPKSSDRIGTVERMSNHHHVVGNMGQVSSVVALMGTTGRPLNAINILSPD
jgi:hypothetical protein